jgi:methionyl-tRNA formyltransferase
MSRLVFFGSPDFAVPALKALSETRFSPALVVTQPDRPSGRGRKRSPTAVREAAGRIGLPVRVIGSFKETGVVEELGRTGGDFFVVVAFGLIFPERVLRIPSVSCINVHASLLPRWRGASPVNMAVAAGDSFSGITIMRMVRELDAGPIYVQRAVPVGPMETAGELSGRLAAEGASLLVEALERITGDGLQPVPQEDEGVTLAPLLSKGDGKIPWEKDAVSVHNRIRGMNPWPGSHTTAGGRMIKVHRSEPADMVRRDLRPGTVLVAEGGSLLVSCGIGCIRLIHLQAEGKRDMPAEDFLRGSSIGEGDLLGADEDE